MTAISDYFCTALLIDDRIESDYQPLESIGAQATVGLSYEPESGLLGPSDDDETPVYPSRLVSSFLAENIVCCIVEAPSDEDSLIDLALRGALISDILILDWLLFEDSSMTVKAIERVTETSKDRLTVIVIFTGESSLKEVEDSLMEDANFEQIRDFVLRRDDSIVLIFGKPGSTLAEDERARTASYDALPNMIRNDLEILFKGLMPEFAFRGINELRKAAPRILTTFTPELDAGALVHRALLPEPPDAGPQFTRLLVSEFEHSLSDAQVGDMWDIDASNESLAQAMVDGDPAELAQKLRSAQTTDPSFRTLEDDRLVRETVAKGLLKMGMKDSAVPARIPELTAAFGNGESSNEALGDC